MIVLSVGIAAVAGAWFLPVIADVWSVVSARVRRRREAGVPDGGWRVLFLVPAHNEEAHIGGCVRSLLRQESPDRGFEVVVLADNCADRTAAAVRELDVRCVERADTSRPGKPEAIAWALDTLELEDVDAVVIIDADAVVDPGFARAMARVPGLRRGGAQAYNGVSNRDDNALTRLAVLFGAARYEFAYPLKQAAGINVPLQGNGMCVGTDVLREHGWRAFSICEDWEVYVQLTLAGYSTRLAPDAWVGAAEATTLRQSASQRRRWSGGKMAVMLRSLAPLLRARGVGLHQRIDLLGELLTVGPAVHAGVAVMLCVAALTAGVPGAVWLCVALLVPLGRTGLYSLLAVMRQPRPIRTLLDFAFFPIYVVWRLGIQASALLMIGDRPWIRTGRNPAPGHRADPAEPGERGRRHGTPLTTHE